MHHISETTLNTEPELNDMEYRILRSVKPIVIDKIETEAITVQGEHGIWMNKFEEEEFRGDLPIDQYDINEDTDPEIIYKKSEDVVEYVQEMSVQYLQPPTPPPPGDIVITQEADRQASPAPPIIIRQQPERAETPEPLVIREAPPTPPPVMPKKVIKISGRQLPPQPRRVIIERLAALPTKPQPIVSV